MASFVARYDFLSWVNSQSSFKPRQTVSVIGCSPGETRSKVGLARCNNPPAGWSVTVPVARSVKLVKRRQSPWHRLGFAVAVLLVVG